MRLGFVTHYDPWSPTAYSGTTARMRQGFFSLGVDLRVVGPLEVPKLLRYRYAALNRIGTKRYALERDTAVATAYARQVEREAVRQRFDAMVSPSTIPVAFVRGGMPTAFWVDALLGSMVGYYPNFDRLSRLSVREGERVERSALENTSLALFSSEWAARGAISRYGADPSRVRVVEYGANLNEALTRESAKEAASSRSRDTCRLLFIGVDWQRKGGAIALEATRLLRSRGLDAQLTVIGSKPFDHAEHPFVTQPGFIDKRSDEGMAAFRDLMARAHFLILPTRADACAVAVAEANAFAVPCLCTRTGGMASVVRDGQNGQLFALDATPADYADYVDRLWSDWPSYLRLAESAYAEYEGRLNWQVACKRVLALLEDAHASVRSCGTRL